MSDTIDDDDDDPHPRFPGRRKNGQIRKGYTGNRKGRPRKARSTRLVFQEMLQSKVTMMVGGRLKRLTVVEAMAARVKQEALTGPLRGLEKGVGVAQTYSLPEPVEGQENYNWENLNDEELEAMGVLLRKLNGLPEESSKSTAVGTDGQSPARPYAANDEMTDDEED